MIILWLVIGIVVGAFFGGVTGAIIGAMLWEATCGPTPPSDQAKINNLAAFMTILGAVAGGFASTWIKRRNEEFRRRQLEADEARRAAEARRQHDDLQRRIFAVRSLCSEAQSGALSLPTTLTWAELDLDRAEAELSKHRYSPFWEATESATAKLNVFDQTLRMIAERRVLHQQRNTAIGELAPVFSLGQAILPDPAATHARLLALYLRAQENPDFANIYEQRRIAAKLDQTNAILVAGFRSLHHAIQDLGDRMVDSISQLQESIEFHLESIQASLESAAAATAEQRNSLFAEIARSGDESASILEQMGQDADRRSEHEHAARRMLDNIQRKRQPTILDPQ